MLTTKKPLLMRLEEGGGPMRSTGSNLLFALTVESPLSVADGSPLYTNI
jgi:hypothetical protein